MEGRSHSPTFRSTVIVNNVRYDSLSGFSTRKAAEQSAAEVALLELTKSGQMKECIPIVSETGLCKNLLQEYAQDMKYAIPSYTCSKQLTGTLCFTSTVEFDGFQYVGAAARTKKEAEINAARIALLAIRGAFFACCSNTSPYNVLPGKIKNRKKGLPRAKEAKHLKPNKTKFKNRKPKRRKSRRKNRKFAKSGTSKTRDISLDARILSAGDAESSGAELAHKVEYFEIVHKVMKLQLEDQKGAYRICSEGASPCPLLPSNKKGRKAERSQPEVTKKLKQKKSKLSNNRSKRSLKRRKDQKFAKSIAASLEKSV